MKTMLLLKFLFLLMKLPFSRILVIKLLLYSVLVAN